MIPTDVQETGTVIDLLDRQPFINQMITVTEKLASRKKNACYAINGAWGVGKSFVITEYEKQIKMFHQKETTIPKYLLFHYDCWKYDYYAEPLTAIIAVMLESIEREVHLLSADTKTTFLAMLKAVGIYALDHFDKRIDRKYGFSPKEIYEAIVTCNEDVLTQIEDSHEYDSYYAIQTTLNRLRESIAELSEHQTIILVVDELDRCLPEYTIKVLERLHHVFENIPNVQIILATDKKQLGHIVRQIYGEETSVEKYLEKFIQFELSLSAGSLNDSFAAMFSAYSNRFEPLIEGILPDDIDSFIKTLFDEVDIRLQIAIVDRCLLVHDLLVDENEKIDRSIMCMELLFSLLRYFNFSNGYFENRIYLSPNLRLTIPNNVSAPQNMHGLTLLDEFYKDNHARIYKDEGNSRTIMFHTDSIRLYSFILGLYRRICGITNDYWYYDHYDMKKYCLYAEKFWSLLKIVH